MKHALNEISPTIQKLTIPLQIIAANPCFRVDKEFSTISNFTTFICPKNSMRKVAYQYKLRHPSERERRI